MALAEPFVIGDDRPADVEAQLGAVRRPGTLAGTIPTVYGEHIVTVPFSWLGAKQRLQAWIACSPSPSTSPGGAWRAVTVGRGGSRSLGPVGDSSRDRRWGTCSRCSTPVTTEPLPFAPATSEEYARIRRGPVA